MAAHELAGPIPRRAAARQHGNAREVPADVLGQLVRGGIAQLGFLAHRLQDDRVEIAAQPPRQARDRFAARGHRRLGPRARLRHRRARPLGIPLADHPDQLLRIAGRDAVRLAAREQLVQHDAERVDVARGRDAAAAHLLGARVLGGHEPHLGAGLRRRLGRAVGLEQLGDAEVQQLRHPGGSDEDVAGLDVAVHDEALVRVLHGAADLPEEREAAVDRQAPVVAPLDERLPLHVLQDEVGLARLRRPAVEQARDVGVIERRRDLALAPEPPQRVLARRARTHELDGDLLLELVVRAAGQVHHPHPAVAELREELVGADPIADPRARRHVEEGRQALAPAPRPPAPSRRRPTRRASRPARGAVRRPRMPRR